VALNRDFIGREFPASPPYEVGREKIREFAEAIGDNNPAYVDPEAAKAHGHPDVIAPPTFAIVLSFRISDAIVAEPGLGLDYSLVVHGEQRFVHLRPIRAGDVLVVTPRVTAIRDAGRNELMTWEADIRTVDGEPVCVATNTLVSRGTAAPKSGG
jgi:acyl dehydratase